MELYQKFKHEIEYGSFNTLARALTLVENGIDLWPAYAYFGSLARAKPGILPKMIRVL